MRRSGWLGLMVLLGAHPLAAQTVVHPPAPLDSARATLRDAVTVLRDSLITIDGAAARLQRDYRIASGPALLSRARAMRDACARSVRTIPPTRAVLQAADVEHPHRQKLRQEVVGALDSLKAVLRTCEVQFSGMSQPDQGEVIRGYGNDRASRVQAGIRSYERHLRSFLQVMGIRIAPLGVESKAPAG